MEEDRDLIVPPIGGRSKYFDLNSSLIKVWKEEIATLADERSKLLEENTDLRRLLLTLMNKSGEVILTPKDLRDIQSNAVIRTEYDARDGSVRVWLTEQ